MGVGSDHIARLRFFFPSQSTGWHVNTSGFPGEGPLALIWKLISCDGIHLWTFLNDPTLLV